MFILQSIVVAILVAITVYFSGGALLQIIAMIRSGAKEPLFSQVKERISSVFNMVFLQKKVLEDKSYGTMHFWYLYGFLILGVGHLELVLYGLTRFLEQFGQKPFLYRNLPLMPDAAIKAFTFSQDFMAFGVVAVVAIALFRRMVMPLPRLRPRSIDAETILWLIGALYVTFFLYTSSETYLRMNEGELSLAWHWYLPVSSGLAMLYETLSPKTMDLFHNAGFFSHLGVFLGFAIYIPRSKHLHLLAAGPNIYFRHLDSYAKPRRIDFDHSETFGVSKVEGLSWKSLLDAFACTECGRCDEVCPAAQTNKPLRPRKILHDIKLNLRIDNWPQIKKYRDWKGEIRAGEEQNAQNYEPKTPLISQKEIFDSDYDPKSIPPGGYHLEGQIHVDELWACTTCAACVEVCPVLIDSVPLSIVDLRRHLVMTEADGYPKEMNAAMRGMEVQKNPWGVGTAKRADWASQLDVPLMADQNGREVEYLFWVGCAGSTDDRAKKIQQALVRILKQARVDFAILGCEEKCTGDPARRMGNEYLFDMLAQENIQTLNSYKFKKIFTSCPHCFNTLQNEYKDYGVDYSVMHHSQLIETLFEDGRLSKDIKKKLEGEITFHDPCYLGRYNKAYEAPRNAIQKACGKTTIEMPLSKEKSFCCGAGGGRMFMEEHQGKRINHARTEQALKTGAKTIATGCPFCMTMITDGLKDLGADEQIAIRDIAEIVAEHMEYTEPAKKAAISPAVAELCP